MYWKALRWGGTAVIILVVVIAALAGSPATTDNAEPAAQPASAQPTNTTKFNF